MSVVIPNVLAMKKILLIIIMGVVIFQKAFSQTSEDLFYPSDVEIFWMGIDFSHVKLIGEFSHFNGAGEKSARQIKKDYFPAWNKLILNEREKYDLEGMMRKDQIIYNIDGVMAINEQADLEEMEVYNPPRYKEEDIQKFIEGYDLSNEKGIGLFLIAECLDKSAKEAYFYFVAISMPSKEILVLQRLRGEPSGFGVRNYWAGAIFHIFDEIKKSHYSSWKASIRKR